MLKHIINKELREIIGSAKFAVTFGVCAVLILLTFYVGGRNFQIAQSHYEAAKAENLQQLSGLTDWLMVQDHRIFLPPDPVSSLVTGISNDIGTSIRIAGRGELNAYGSFFNEEPIFAVFRFLDLTFIFQIILSLFAILFAYDAINGEREKGTLKLTIASAIPRATYIFGKILGSFLGLTVPLLIPILIGCLLLPLLGVPLKSDDWLRLSTVIAAGFLYFAAFLTLSIFLSAITRRSTSSFVLSLVIWIFAVLIVPRTAVLLAGRAVDVPTVDKLQSEKGAYSRQLWKEHREKLLGYKSEHLDKPIDDVMADFNKFMDDLNAERDKKALDFAAKLNEQRRNKLQEQERFALGIARFSPAAAFALSATELSGTSLDLKSHFNREASAYQESYATFIRDKTGINPGSGMRVRITDDGEKPEEINPHELPAFTFTKIPFAEACADAAPNLALLVLFNVLFFAGAFTAFLRYDVR